MALMSNLVIIGWYEIIGENHGVKMDLLELKGLNLYNVDMIILH